MRLLNNVAIFITLAVAYNLINGVCGQLHLGPNAFITLGAYTAALLTMTPAEKTLNFLVTPLYWPLSQAALPFPAALLAGGLVAVAFGLLTGFPVFRVRGDYLAIVTLGFGEVVRVLANNLQGLTNGPLGLKGLYPYTNLWWSWGVAVAATAMVAALVNSSYGRALNAIREDETAAKAIGDQHLSPSARGVSSERLLVRGGRRAAGPPHHHHFAVALHLFPHLQSLDHHCGGGPGLYHRGDSGRGRLHPGRGVAEDRGGAGRHLRAHHPGHSGDADGDSLPGAAPGDHLLPPGSDWAAGNFPGRAAAGLIGRFWCKALGKAETPEAWIALRGARRIWRQINEFRRK